MINATILGNRIFSSSQDAFSLYEKSRFGEKKAGKIDYASVEALHLLEENKMILSSGNKKIDFETLLKKTIRSDKRALTKYRVFSDLRKKGYVVKTALKFGSEFRVYEKGVKPGDDHAKWILFTTNESENMNWHEFAAKNRVAHSTKKRLLIGIVDEESDVTYYEINWLRP